jgi:hypothetical protein
VTNLADHLAGISHNRINRYLQGEKLLMPRLLWDNIELLGCGIVIPALMNSGIVFYLCNTPISLAVFVTVIGGKIAIRDLQ